MAENENRPGWSFWTSLAAISAAFVVAFGVVIAIRAVLIWQVHQHRYHKPAIWPAAENAADC